MAEVENLGELKRIDGADWDVEIGAVTELGHHRGEQSKALLFDNIKGYPEGYRVLSNTLNTTKRLAVTLGMPTSGFTYVQGTPKQFRRSDLDSPVTREFCGECGRTSSQGRPVCRAAY